MARSSRIDAVGSEPLLTSAGLEMPERRCRNESGLPQAAAPLVESSRIPLSVLARHVFTGFKGLLANESDRGRSRRLQAPGSNNSAADYDEGSTDPTPNNMPAGSPSPLQFIFAACCNRVMYYATAAAAFVSCFMYVLAYKPHRHRPEAQALVCFMLMLSSFAMLLDVIIGRGSRLLSLYPRISLVRVLLLSPSSVLLCVVTKDGGLLIVYAIVHASTILWILWQCRANRLRNETAAADANPTQWNGVNEVIACVSSGDAGIRMNCATCKLIVDGACCYVRGQCTHFGCADEETQNLCAGMNEEAQSCGTMLDNFYTNVLSGQPLYRFRLDVEKVYAIVNQGLEQAFEDSKRRLDVEQQNIKQLYHGTPYANVKSILDSGFRLPTWAGMFGKGIYFAETPQKSWSFGNHYLLVCDVLLGRQCRLDDASPNFVPGDEIESVVGLRHAEGGVLRETEYVVYNPSQVVPRFLLQLTSTRVAE